MKLLLAIAAVTVMMKTVYTFPAPAAGSLSNTDIAFIEALDRENKLFTDQSVAIVQKALSLVPSGQSYEEHRQNFRDFLQASEDYKSLAEDCVVKRSKYSHSFGKFMETYSEKATNGSAEHQEMVTLLREQGMQDFMDRLKVFAQRTSRGEFGTPSKDSHLAVMEYMATHC